MLFIKRMQLTEYSKLNRKAAADCEMLSFSLLPECLAEIGAWMRRQWLRLSPDKKKVISVGKVKQIGALSFPYKNIC